MDNLVPRVGIAFFAVVLTACSSGSSSPNVQDGGSTDAQATDSAASDSSTADSSTPDSAMDSSTAVKAQWTLNAESWVVGPLGPQCQGGGANGFTLAAATTSPTNSGVTFTLSGAKPTADTTYAVMIPQPGPPPAGMAYARVSVPAGTASEDHKAQSGSVVVTVVGGIVTATLATSPSKGSIGMATGTISGTVTCP